MLSTLLKARPVLDEASVEWMFDCFAWALRNFDARVFYDETILVTPSNEHFPGRGGSAQDMAQLIFEQVKDYAGVKHWPCRLVDDDSVSTLPAASSLLPGPRRGRGDTVPAVVDGPQPLLIPYRADNLRDPEVLIANYAHVLAHYLASLGTELPPGGEQNWPHATELLAVFLGFGLMMANSAFTTKIRSCSSCAAPAVERTNYLSQYDISYALAIFCAVKDISPKQVLPHLKKTLRPFYKKAYKEVMANPERFDSLKARSNNGADSL
jgi:hypothetical protein